MSSIIGKRPHISEINACSVEETKTQSTRNMQNAQTPTITAIEKASSSQCESHRLVHRQRVAVCSTNASESFTDTKTRNVVMPSDKPDWESLLIWSLLRVRKRILSYRTCANLSSELNCGVRK